MFMNTQFAENLRSRSEKAREKIGKAYYETTLLPLINDAADNKGLDKITVTLPVDEDHVLKPSVTHYITWILKLRVYNEDKDPNKITISWEKPPPSPCRDL